MFCVGELVTNPAVRDKYLPEWKRFTMSGEERQALERSVYYSGCDEARAAGTAPIYAGQPGYREALDGDGDGVACETFPR